MYILPKDVIMYMGLYLKPNDIINFSLTNTKYYNFLCNNNLFWMNKVLYDYGQFGHIPKIINYKHMKFHREKYYGTNVWKFGNYNYVKFLWKDYYKKLCAPYMTQINNTGPSCRTPDIIIRSLLRDF